MCQNILPRPRNQENVNLPRIDRMCRRRDAEEMLREIAFVLEMTRRVRQEMEREEAREPAVV